MLYLQYGADRGSTKAGDKVQYAPLGHERSASVGSRESFDSLHSLCSEYNDQVGDSLNTDTVLSLRNAYRVKTMD